jgi:hypothetical protein
LCKIILKKQNQKRIKDKNNLLVSNKEIEQGKQKTGKKVEKQDDDKMPKQKKT